MEDIQLVVGALIICLIPYLRRTFFFPAPKVEHPEVVSHELQPFFDVARGLAIISVVVIHAVYLLMIAHPHDHVGVLTVINNLGRFAIPFFFLCSGILLTPSEGFYTRKLVRIFIPYVVM